MSNRIYYIDTLRVFSIICVVLIHSTAYINTIYGPNSYVTILGNFGRFSVTLFIFLSGLCLSLKYINRPINYGKFVIHYLWKLVPFYIIWNFIYQFYYQGKLNISLSGLKVLFYGKAASHLYFVPVIIGLYLIFPLLWKLKNKASLILIASFVIQISTQILRYYALLFEIPIAKAARAFFPLYIGYFVLGIFCAINYSRVEAVVLKYSFVIVTATVISFSLNNLVPNDVTYQLYYLLSIPTMFIIFNKVSTPLFSNLAQVGYYIYLIHYLILDILVNYLKLSNVSPLLSSIFLTVLTYALSYFTFLLYLKFKTKIGYLFNLLINCAHF